MDEQLIKISGTIERFIFHNQENGFAVCLLALDKEKSITISGTLPYATAGQEVDLMGSWVTHKKFGRQFSVAHCVHKIPASVTGLKKYLGSGLIKGIGANYAEKLVDHFGAGILSIIEHQPERLEEVDGIGKKRAGLITQSFIEHKEIAHTMIFLQDHGISPAYAAKIYKHYKNKAIDVLKENPYRLADEVWGIGFKLADEIAQKMGIDQESPKRLSAGIMYALQVQSQTGQSYVEKETFFTQASTLLNVSSTPEGQAVLRACYGDLIVQERIKEIIFQHKEYCALMTHYQAERSVAEKIHALTAFPASWSVDLQKIYTQLAQSATSTLSEEQQKSIIHVLSNKVSIITGGPGTGKTTLVKTLISVLEQEKITYKLAAPTGRAAKRMSEQTQRFATTIHRLLEIDPQSFTFVHNETNALKLQILIIDESSMIDIFLANALLKAVPLYARVVFLGDKDQLPSVGPGNFLADCLASPAIAHIKLTHIFRQAQHSLITVNAHRIITGQPLLKQSPETRNDWIFIKEENPENLFNHIIECYQGHLKKFSIAPSKTTILTPMNRGIAGNFTLNHHLQNFLNSEPGPSISSGAQTFKVRDRVMQLRNNYEKLVFNGDCGSIQDINHTDKTVTVLFTEKEVIYDFDELTELILAYSMTIHKSQGSEYDAVIIPLFMQHYTLLARNLVYTAITRAKKLCIIIGQPKALYCALGQSKTSERLTFLTHYLNKEL